MKIKNTALYNSFYIIISILLITSCQNPNERVQPKSEHIDVNYQSYPLFKDIAHVDTQNISSGLNELSQRYGDFFDFYWQTIVQVDSPKNYSSELIKYHLTQPDYRHLLDTVNQVFKDYSDIDNEIKILFQNIKFYDSNFKLPQHVVYINSFLQSPAFTWENYLGIGFDMYFGEDFWPYESENVRIPRFISRFNIRKNIPIAAAKVLYTQMYPIVEEDKSLLDLMVMNGKSMLFLDHVLPKHHMSAIINMTDEQWKWCEENEYMIYNFFTSNNLLYEKNAVKIMRYIAPAPNSMGMPEEAPGRTAVYVGYKILKNYQNETGKSLTEILNENIDAQKILKLSQYKPTQK